MPKPVAQIVLEGVATSDDVAAIRRELSELRKAIEQMAQVAHDGLMSREQAARYLAVSTSTLDGLHIPRVSIGTAVRYRRETLDEWTAEHERAEAA
ncbi:MAG TPA: hypothetical protein VIM11_15525 [Tepidisphaeraceae bacterium]|jgi:hypothetical protein